MDRVFPFGLPPATAFYALVYVLTWTVHYVFVSFLIAGTAYVVAASAGKLGMSRITTTNPVVEMLTDWMPFAVGAAITAGVAPLLFVQILYPTSFYTANLLLSHRWMSIVPVLIVAFYLTYVLKTVAGVRRRPWAMTAISLLTLLGFAFVGYTWSENHSLTTVPKEWPEFHASGRWAYFDPSAVARSVMWFGLSFPTLSLIVIWARRFRSGPLLEMDARSPRVLSILSLVGIAAAFTAAVMHGVLLDEARRRVLIGWFGGPWAVLALLGLVAQALPWIPAYRTSQWALKRLVAASIVSFLTSASLAVVRETIRLSTTDISVATERMTSAAEVGGFPVFLFFALVNAALIVLCIRLVGGKSPPSGAADAGH